MEPSGNELVVEEAVACFDPECVDEAGTPSLAHPEQDGDYTYLSCPTCGGEFGFRRIGRPVNNQATCAVGIPATLRRDTPHPPQHRSQQPLLLHIGRRPDGHTA